MDEQSKQQDQAEDVEAHIAHRGKGFQDEPEDEAARAARGRAARGRSAGHTDDDDDVQAHIAHRG